MAMRKYKPTSAGLRQRVTVTDEDLSKSGPCKELLKRLDKRSGRNNQGKLTVRNRGGGAKRMYRMVDFKRDIESEGKIIAKEYDPYRTAHIALVQYKNGKKGYVILSNSLNVGDKIESGERADIKPGNHLALRYIPTGSSIHNVEIHKGRGGQLARSAGAYAILQAKSDKHATVKLPSGEVRLILLDCKATLGEVGNSKWRNRKIGKAGANRWRGRRPHVRGAVMNPCDHPHGGGEGRAPAGMHPVSAKGKLAIGKKTGKTKGRVPGSTNLVVKERNRKR